MKLNKHRKIEFLRNDKGETFWQATLYGKALSKWYDNGKKYAETEADKELKKLEKQLTTHKAKYALHLRANELMRQDSSINLYDGMLYALVEYEALNNL